MKNLIIQVLCWLVIMTPAAGAAEFRFSPKPNKAHQIQWREWGPEALREARSGNKLILLSLSAVWCHWCHVMDETTYSQDEIIATINAHFIPIRVDSDLRPDINTLYNQGGWPSTAILTPQGEVLSGGNYVPPEELLSLLRRIQALFLKEPDAITKRIEEVSAMNVLDSMQASGLRSLPGRRDLRNIEAVLVNSFDSMYGGFGGGQKFPNPDAISYLLSRQARNRDAQTEAIITRTLDHMAKGAIHDRVEGGFFRYATRQDWSEPHYEKMLEVNAGMIRNYAEASLVFGRKEYLDVVRDCMRFAQASLYDPGTGVFYSSQDADAGYYQKKNRKGLKAPLIDRTVYADSSALMVSALISAHYATGQRSYLDMAVRSADFMTLNMSAGVEGMFHSYRNGAPALKGLLSDNVLFGAALLDLYNATGEKRYLKNAVALGMLIIGHFYNAATMRFQFAHNDALVNPVTAGFQKKVNENLANYRALQFLSRLVLTGDYPGWQEVLDAVAITLSGEYQRFTPHAGTFGIALLYTVGEPVQITIVASENEAIQYIFAINRMYIPERVVRVLSLSEDAAEIKRQKYLLEEAAYVCTGKRCSAPVNDPDVLQIEVKNILRKMPTE